MESIIIGFEFEFASRYTQHEQIEILSKLPLPGSAVTGYYDRWRLGTDQSIRYREGFTPHEIVSPPMVLKDGMSALKTILAWMRANHVEVNNTTGLHINLSYLNDKLMKDIDPLKLILFLDEDDILRRFQRSRNGFCQGHQGVLRHQCYRGYVKDKRGLYGALIHDKDMFVNISKLRDGYLEFRAIGNRNYHRREAEIINTIKHFIYCMDLSRKPWYKLREYKKRVETILRGE